MTILSTASLVLLLSTSCSTLTLSNAFSPVSRLPTGSIHTSAGTCTCTALYNAASDKTSEKVLRDEIAKRNANVENEEKYAMTEGEGMEGALQDGTDTSNTDTNASIHASTDADTSSTGKKSLQAKIERMVEPRAYSLFVAEKLTEIAEGIVDGAVQMTSSIEIQIGTPTEPTSKGTTKEKIVILGTGWGAASFLKNVDTSLYDVTVISPRNYFLFTPMLAGASVGTVEYRSITEPIREINRKAEFLEGTATNIDTQTNTVSCESVVCDGNTCDIEDFIVTYDRLIVTVGAQTNTFGIPGVREHCCFLKQVEDARRIRTAIVNCFERANLPKLTDEERINGLTFAVIGAGPTGIEFAAELRDFIEQDGPKYYPNLLKFVRIKVIEASSTVLAPFDKSLQNEAIQQMTRNLKVADPQVANLLPERFRLTELMLDSSVKEVNEDSIQLNDGREVKYGIAVWAAGNGPLPISLQLIEELGEQQANEQAIARGRVAVDYWLRAVGSNGKILCFGDCSVNTASQLPATAQVAAQQGEYLASIMNHKYDLSPDHLEGIFPPPTRDPDHDLTPSEAIAGFATQGSDYAKPFQFWNLGILAYTGGGSALAQVPLLPDKAKVKGKGAVGNAIWKSVYLSKQVSGRNRFLVLNDWIKRRLFGRDITRV